MITEAIAGATDVIVILSNAVVQSDDTYVGREFEFALAYGKSIVPVTTPSFVWPAEDASPQWLNSIRQYHAVAVSWDYPDAFAQRLLSFCTAPPAKHSLLDQLAFSERVNDFATPCFINLLCRVVLFQSVSFPLAVG